MNDETVVQGNKIGYKTEKDDANLLQSASSFCKKCDFR